jgi:hypothetical protein
MPYLRVMSESLIETSETCPRCKARKVQKRRQFSDSWGAAGSGRVTLGDPYCPHCTVQQLQEFEREQD